MRKGAVLLAAVLLAPRPAGAQTIQDRLEDARAAEQSAKAEAGAAAADLAGLSRRYDRLQARANAAAARLIDSYLRESTLQAELVQAQELLDDRANAAYRAGPAAFLEVMFDSSSLHEMVARQELIEHALLADVDEAGVALEARVEAREVRRELEQHRVDLSAQQAELAEIRTLMEIRLASAQDEANRAGVRVQALVDEQRELAQAAAEEQRFVALVDAGEVTGAFGRLLAMLGPEGGRGCDIPADLESTGQTFSGEASFYGEEFAGNPTAIGHIFNPELFTAAHRTLPLPSFLQVRYGGRCANVLVNDRGPYVDGRILDLSEGAARYLGLPGVGQVDAEILVPR